MAILSRTSSERVDTAVITYLDTFTLFLSLIDPLLFVVKVNFNVGNATNTTSLWEVEKALALLILLLVRIYLFLWLLGVSDREKIESGCRCRPRIVKAWLVCAFCGIFWEEKGWERGRLAVPLYSFFLLLWGSQRSERLYKISCYIHVLLCLILPLPLLLFFQLFFSTIWDHFIIQSCRLALGLLNVNIKHVLTELRSLVCCLLFMFIEYAILAISCANACIQPYSLISNLLDMLVILILIPIQFNGKTDPFYLFTIPEITNNEHVRSLTLQEVGFDFLILPLCKIGRKEYFFDQRLGHRDHIFYDLCQCLAICLVVRLAVDTQKILWLC